MSTEILAQSNENEIASRYDVKNDGFSSEEESGRGLLRGKGCAVRAAK